MKIGELAQKTGVSIRSIRYYEEKKLITPKRLENGYRIYNEMDLERVKAIQLFLDLGLKTEEIHPIFSCGSLYPVDHNSKCSISALSLYQEKLDRTREQIESLKKLEAELENLIKFWTKVSDHAEGNV